MVSSSTTTMSTASTTRAQMAATPRLEPRVLAKREHDWVLFIADLHPGRRQFRSNGFGQENLSTRSGVALEADRRQIEKTQLLRNALRAKSSLENRPHPSVQLVPFDRLPSDKGHSFQASIAESGMQCLPNILRICPGRRLLGPHQCEIDRPTGCAYFAG